VSTPPDSPAVGPISFSPELFEQLFPFYFAIDGAGRVTRAGPSLRRLAPSCRPGTPWGEVFLAKRPARLPDPAVLRGAGRRLFVFNLAGADTLYRGQAVAQGEEVFLLGAPWFTDPAELTARGLTLNDFAVHDSTPDLVQVLQIQQIATGDLKRLAEKLATAGDNLRRQEAEARRLALIASRTDNAVILTDATGRIEWANDAFTRLTGYTSESARGRRPGEILQGTETDPATVAFMRDKLARGEGFQTELLNYRYDGRPYWISLEVQPIRDEEGRLVNYMGIHSDITRRRELEYSLRAGEERFALALNATGEGVWDWDIAADLVRHNQRWIDLLGCGAERLQHPAAFSIERIHPQDREAVAARIRLCLQGGGPYLSQHRMVRMDGAVIWVRDRGDVAQRGEGGGPLRMVGSLAEITVERRAEESLRVQSGLAGILSSAASMTEAGEAVLRVIGSEMRWRVAWLWLAREDEGELDCASAWGQDEAAGALAEARRRANAPGGDLPGRVWSSGVLESVEREGGLAVGAPIRTAGGVRGVMEVFAEEEATPDPERLRTLETACTQLGQFIERSRAEERLRRRGEELAAANAGLAEASRAKDAFLASMSHELRTPLNSVLGLSESLAECLHGPLNEKQARYISLILTSGRHLLALINDILDLAKIESGEDTLRCEPHGLAGLCEQALQLVQPLAAKRRQRVLPELPPEAVRVRVDGRRLVQILVNLLGNAVKFTPEDGEIGLRVKADGAGLRLAVWDRGIGIDAEGMKKLFAPFVQIDGRLSRKYDGTGLGLALVKNLTEMHGGRVEVESVPEEGSTFTLVFPPEVLLAEAEPRVPLVLIAEDNALNIFTLREYLEHHGCRILHAENGEQALALAITHRPDVILMDVQMPVMDGLEATRRLRAQADAGLARTPVIALTAMNMVGDRELCLAAGVDDYIPKPASPKLVLERVLERFAQLLDGGGGI
jgi:PAS domain S-box-containing protein